MELRAEDYQRLVNERNMDVFGELVKLNTTSYYHYTLDVLNLCRKLNMERIKNFLK
ncbi:MAG: hypothetical protein ACKVOR_08605 [Flavobacteriales bacterium]